MSKIGFPEKVLEKRKICDYQLLRKVEQNQKNRNNLKPTIITSYAVVLSIVTSIAIFFMNINPQKDLKPT